MTTDIPGYVRAWAKVHGVEARWTYAHWNACPYQDTHGAKDDDLHRWTCGEKAWRTKNGPVPDFNPDAWLAGMFRAMTGDGGRLVVEHDDRGYAAIWNKPYVLGAGVSVGEAPTLEDAICAAVNGGSDA